jgi:hypothetical protein
MSLRRSVTWVRQWDEEDTLVWIDVAKLDAEWQRDIPFYIGSSGKNGSPAKYARVGEWVDFGSQMWMPHVNLNFHVPQQIAFTDGRHRFAWMRDHGVTALPITVAPNEATEFTKRFGTRRRTSWIRF